MTGKYYRGLVRPEGISLYDLAADVLKDAQVDEKDYFIDPYLQNVIVYNPVPVVRHTEALQMIANAGRCVLTQDRKKRIHIQSSFTPDMTASSGDQTPFSNVQNILKEMDLKAYAMASTDFSKVDKSVFFLPENNDYLDIGYVSASVANDQGIFESHPVITINLESGYSCFGLMFKFRNTAPNRFAIHTYYNDVAVDEINVENPEVEEVVSQELELFDRMDITFYEAPVGSRITLDRISFGDATDYVLDDRELIGNSPVGAKEDRIKSISVKKTIYEKANTAAKALSSGNITVTGNGTDVDIVLSKASYDFTVSTDNAEIECEIVESFSYFVKIRLSGLGAGQVANVKYTLSGYEYEIYESFYTISHDTTGTEKIWKNALISNDSLAADLQEWLAAHFLGGLVYNFKYRGDPRVDANDLFFMQRRQEEKFLIRAHETQLSYKGAWSGSMKARRIR